MTAITLTGNLTAVSMKSGLEGRNNCVWASTPKPAYWVSMKSGLEGRNNVENRDHTTVVLTPAYWVSMKSGLEGRNNQPP